MKDCRGCKIEGVQDFVVDKLKPHFDVNSAAVKSTDWSDIWCQSFMV